MRKSLKISLHLLFWAMFPLLHAFSGWADAHDVLPGFESLPQPGFLHFLAETVRILFVPVDVGRPITDISNVMGILFTLFIYLLIPLGMFYLFYSRLVPAIINKKGDKRWMWPLLLLVLGPLVLVMFFRFFTIAVAWKMTYCLTIAYMSSILFALAGSLFRITENWIVAEKTARQNLQSELSLLRNQINPHFLFNTLNSIDSLIQSNKDKASEVLLRLSGILRYMIYESNESSVPLSKEIDHMKSYIELQRIQSSNPELVNFSLSGNPEGIRIAPMLFIPFVENAFKHCTNKSMSGAIRISFQLDGKRIIFECINSYDGLNTAGKDPTAGIGLPVVRRRLELIYPSRHHLEIREERATFHVLLTLDTHDN
jgi:hypothetical protein